MPLHSADTKGDNVSFSVRYAAWQPQNLLGRGRNARVRSRRAPVRAFVLTETPKSTLSRPFLTNRRVH